MLRPVAEVRRHQAATRVAALIRAACANAGLTPTELQAGSRRGSFPRLRAALACRLVAKGGLWLAETARHLGVSTPAITKILRRTEGAAGNEGKNIISARILLAVHDLRSCRVPLQQELAMFIDHDLSMAHSSKVGRDHSQIYIAPRIGLPAGVGPKKNDLLDTHSLSQAIYGLPNYFFDASRRFNRFHRASV